MKPKLYCVGRDTWFCKGGTPHGCWDCSNTLGMGRTPELAYKNWLEMQKR